MKCMHYVALSDRVARIELRILYCSIWLSWSQRPFALLKLPGRRDGNAWWLVTPAWRARKPNHIGIDWLIECFGKEETTPNKRKGRLLCLGDKYWVNTVARNPDHWIPARSVIDFREWGCILKLIIWVLDGWRDRYDPVTYVTVWSILIAWWLVYKPDGSVGCVTYSYTDGMKGECVYTTEKLFKLFNTEGVNSAEHWKQVKGNNKWKPIVLVFKIFCTLFKLDTAKKLITHRKICTICMQGNIFKFILVKIFAHQVIVEL